MTWWEWLLAGFGGGVAWMMALTGAALLLGPGLGHIREQETRTP